MGRRLDPVTGKIYHIKNFPPESEEIRERLVTRPDDSEEKVYNMQVQCNVQRLGSFHNDAKCIQKFGFCR